MEPLPKNSSQRRESNVLKPPLASRFSVYFTGYKIKEKEKEFEKKKSKFT